MVANGHSARRPPQPSSARVGAANVASSGRSLADAQRVVLRTPVDPLVAQGVLLESGIININTLANRPNEQTPHQPPRRASSLRMRRRRLGVMVIAFPFVFPGEGRRGWQQRRWDEGCVC